MGSAEKCRVLVWLQAYQEETVFLCFQVSVLLPLWCLCFQSSVSLHGDKTAATAFATPLHFSTSMKERKSFPDCSFDNSRCIGPGPLSWDMAPTPKSTLWPRKCKILIGIGLCAGSHVLVYIHMYIHIATYSYIIIPIACSLRVGWDGGEEGRLSKESSWYDYLEKGKWTLSHYKNKRSVPPHDNVSDIFFFLPTFV